MAGELPQNVGFEIAFKWFKDGHRISRKGWKGRRKWIELAPAAGKHLSYLCLVYEDGTKSPWTPTRCDLLEEDWDILPDFVDQDYNL